MEVSSRSWPQFVAVLMSALVLTAVGIAQEITDDINVSSTSSIFGKVTSARDPRQLQLALKLLF